MTYITKWEEMVDPKYFRMTEEILGVEKSKLWWNSRIKALGNLRPRFIVTAGKTFGLYQFIQTSYDEDRSRIEIPWQNGE